MTITYKPKKKNPVPKELSISTPTATSSAAKSALHGMNYSMSAPTAAEMMSKTQLALLSETMDAADTLNNKTGFMTLEQDFTALEKKLANIPMTKGYYMSGWDPAGPAKDQTVVKKTAPNHQWMHNPSNIDIPDGASPLSVKAPYKIKAWVDIDTEFTQSNLIVSNYSTDSDVQTHTVHELSYEQGLWLYVAHLPHAPHLDSEFEIVFVRGFNLPEDWLAKWSMWPKGYLLSNMHLILDCISDSTNIETTCKNPYSRYDFLRNIAIIRGCWKEFCDDRGLPYDHSSRAISCE